MFPVCRTRGVQQAELPVSLPFLVSKSPLLPRYMGRACRQWVCPWARGWRSQRTGSRQPRAGHKGRWLAGDSFPRVAGAGPVRRAGQRCGSSLGEQAGLRGAPETSLQGQLGGSSHGEEAALSRFGVDVCCTRAEAGALALVSLSPTSVRQEGWDWQSRMLASGGNPQPVPLCLLPAGPLGGADHPSLQLNGMPFLVKTEQL